MDHLLSKGEQDNFAKVKLSRLSSLIIKELSIDFSTTFWMLRISRTHWTMRFFVCKKKG